MKKKNSTLTNSCCGLKDIIFVALSLYLLTSLSCTRETPKPDPIIPTVTTADVLAITMTTASSGGNISFDGGATITSRGLCWGLISNPTITDSKTSDGFGLGSFTSSITGLEAGTTYHVRAYAKNSVGIAYGLDVHFSTTPIMFPVTITYGANGTASSTLKEVASGSSLPILVTANSGFIPDSVKVNGVSSPLGRSITTYNLTNVTKATNAYFTFRLDLNAIINQKAWKKDSTWIEQSYGWGKYAYDVKDSVFFLPTGRYAVYRAGTLVGDGNWSIIENLKPVPVLMLGGSPWDIEKLDQSSLVTIMQVANIDPKITQKIWVKDIYKRYPSGK